MKDKISLLIQNTLIVCAIFVVAFLLSSRLFPKFGYNLFTIQSGSMQPHMKIGSIVIAHRQSDYNVGDIITFRQGQKDIVTHRVVGVVNKDGNIFYETKGDANKANDIFLTDKKFVFGKDVLAIPFLGYIILFSRTKLGLILLIVIPAAWFIIEEGINLKKMLAKRKIQAV